MTKLFLLFNHQLTPTQKTDAIDTLGIDVFITPPDNVRRLWSQIPPDLTTLSDYLQPVQS